MEYVALLINKLQQKGIKKQYILVVLACGIIVGSAIAIRHHKKAVVAQVPSTQTAAPVSVASALSATTTTPATLTTVSPVIKPIIVTVRSNDNLTRIYKRLGLNPQDAKKVLALKSAQSLHHLNKGQKLSVIINPAHKGLQQLVYAINDTDTLTISSIPALQAHVTHIEPTMRLQYMAASVGSSIYTTGKKVGLPKKIVQQFASIFNNRTNFAKGIYKGDKIAVYYREYCVNNKVIREGDIAAAELIHNAKKYRIIGFLDNSGNNSFYTPQGYNLVPPFMRFPLKYKSIGDRFSMARLEPILGIVRPHFGVDLRAPYGTPIKAASDGVITLAGRKGGYGNAITLQHGIYTTLYAHLSRFNIHAGSYVKQGQVIGFVGATGLATGPHLHYEFHINGVPHDPLKVALPTGEMIAAAYRSKFFAFSRSMLAKLDMQRNVKVAMDDDAGNAKI